MIESETDISLRWVLTMCGICLLGIFSFGLGLSRIGVLDAPTQLDRIELHQALIISNQEIILEKLDGSE